MRYKNIIILLTLFFIGTICVLASSALQLAGTEDRNNDGKPDRWIYVGPNGGLIIRSDNNFDGVIDYVLEVDERGNKIYEEYDYNHDGKMDTFYFYANGVLQRKEIDSNFDGEVDIWIYLEEGVYVVRLERDTDFDGKVDFVRRYR